MLRPAILYKNEIERRFSEVIYSDDYFYYMGYAHGHELPKMEPVDNVYQWAIVNKANEAIGWFAYQIDPVNDSVYNFGLYSFDKGNVLIGKDVFEKMEELIAHHRRIEWRVIEGNPVIRSYDKLCKRHNGHKVVFYKITKDPDGIYRNEYVYEILSESEEMKDGIIINRNLCDSYINIDKVPNETRWIPISDKPPEEKALCILRESDIIENQNDIETGEPTAQKIALEMAIKALEQEFNLEEGYTMPERIDLEYKGARC